MDGLQAGNSCNTPRQHRQAFRQSYTTNALIDLKKSLVGFMMSCLHSRVPNNSELTENGTCNETEAIFTILSCKQAAVFALSIQKH